MNKQELCNQIAKKTDLPKTKVLEMMDCCFEEITKSVKKGQPVRLVGFGTWKKTRRKARTGRNPQTGAALKIKARNVAKFSMGQGFADLIN